MKAVKLSKIQWDLRHLSPEEKEEALKKLPTVKGFKADDDFKVAEKVPLILKKKFGYDIIDFSFTSIHIITDIKEMFLLGMEGGPLPKKVKFFKKGKGGRTLSDFGEECALKLKDLIRRRLRLQEHGTDPSMMPKILDQLMISWEAITGMNWEDQSTLEQIYGPLWEELQGAYAVNLKDGDEEDLDDERDEDDEDEEGDDD